MQNSTMRASSDFETLYRNHFRHVYRVCFSYLKNQADAEDVTEDVFVKVLRENINFTDSDHEAKWLTVTAINMSKNLLKSKKRKNIPLDELPEISAEDEAPGRELLYAVMKLPEKYRDVIWLHYYQGYKTDEIAKMLNRLPSTVRGQLRDARLLLKKELGGFEE